MVDPDDPKLSTLGNMRIPSILRCTKAVDVLDVSELCVDVSHFDLCLS